MQLDLENVKLKQHNDDDAINDSRLAQGIRSH